MSNDEYTYEWKPCPSCGKRIGHALTCDRWQVKNPPAREIHPPGTRAELLALREQVKALKAELTRTVSREVSRTLQRGDE